MTDKEKKVIFSIIGIVLLILLVVVVISVFFGKQKPVDNNINTNKMTEEYGTKQESDAVEWKELAELAKLVSNDSSIKNTTNSVTKSVNGKQVTLTVGDIKKIKYNGKILRTRVLGFNHDELSNKNAYGSTTATGKAGISFEFLDCMGTHIMNPPEGSYPYGHNIGGWEKTNMRIYLQGELSKITASKYFKEVNKEYIATHNDQNSVKKCSDKLWLLSASEVVNDGYNHENTRGYAITTEGEEYQYYKTVKDDWNISSVKRTKYLDGNSGQIWWLRSSLHADGDGFCTISENGEFDTNIPSGGFGVAPGFAI